MQDEFINKLYKAHEEARRIPAPQLVRNWLNGLLRLSFPELADARYRHVREFKQAFEASRLELFAILDTMQDDLPAPALAIEQSFMDTLPQVHALLEADADAILQGDPAAVNRTEVIRTYPGFYAVAVYRLAHEFYKLKVPLVPRILTESAHTRTGVDIHPGATIGERFCIDHGSGVVLGETVEIGNDVKIYQGVTLGALSVRKEMARIKRHPTVGDRVIIYAGATILGGETVIGADSIIGGNTWITGSVPPNSRIYYDPDRLSRQDISHHL